MSPDKNFLNATKEYFNSVEFFRFLLSAYIYVFALGGLFYLLGAFVLSAAGFFSFIGIVLMYAGLILTLIQEDVMTLLITSGIISLGSLIAGVIGLIRVFNYSSLYALVNVRWYEPLFYFLAFGTITLFVLIKSEKFKQMRASRAQVAGITCPRCGGFVPMTSGFCPSCGAKNPAQQQYAVPVQPQYAPPVQPQYAPPVQPQYAPPVQTQYAPPVQPQYAPPVQPQYTPPVQPQYAPPVQPQPPKQSEPMQAAPIEQTPPSDSVPTQEATPVVSKCVSCGADIPQGAIFCGKCGAKQ